MNKNKAIFKDLRKDLMHELSYLALGSCPNTYQQAIVKIVDILNEIENML